MYVVITLELYLFSILPVTGFNVAKMKLLVLFNVFLATGEYVLFHILNMIEGFMCVKGVKFISYHSIWVNDFHRVQPPLLNVHIQV